MSQWWFVVDESSISLEKNGVIKGKVKNVLPANNPGFIKVIFNNDDSTLYELKKFESKKNNISSEFKPALLSRSKFVETWKKIVINDVSMEVNGLTNQKPSDKSENSTTIESMEVSDLTNQKHSDKSENSTTIETMEVSDLTNQKHSDKSENSTIIETSMKEDSILSRLNTESQAQKSCIDESNNRTVPTGIKGKLREEPDPFSSRSFQTAEAIQSKLVGYFDVPVEKLVQPRWNSLTREPEDWHIKQLKEEFMKSPFSYFTLMVINIPGVEKEAFNGENIESYVMETIGGNHSRIALQELMKENSHQKHLYESRIAAIYCNLTPDESKRKGNEHNAIHKFGLDMNFTSRIISFRCSLYHKAGSTDENDIFTKDTPDDKTLIQEWKKGLELATGSENREALNNHYRFEINLAKTDVDTWKELFGFFQNWSQNKISGVPKCSKSKQRREISSRNVRCLDGLTPSRLKEVLIKVNSGEITYKQMTELCDQEKKSDKLKKTKRKNTEGVEPINTVQTEISESQNADHETQTPRKQKKHDEQEIGLQLEETKIRLDAALRKINELMINETTLQEAQTKYAKELSELQKKKQDIVG